MSNGESQEAMNISQPKNTMLQIWAQRPGGVETMRGYIQSMPNRAAGLIVARFATVVQKCFSNDSVFFQRLTCVIIQKQRKKISMEQKPHI